MARAGRVLVSEAKQVDLYVLQAMVTLGNVVAAYSYHETRLLLGLVFSVRA